MAEDRHELTAVEVQVERYRDGAMLSAVPSGLLGLLTMTNALYQAFHKGAVLSGLILLLAGYAMAWGAWIVARQGQAQGLRGVTVSTVGAAVASVLLVLGHGFGRLSVRWDLIGSFVYLSGPALLLLAYCLASAVSAWDAGVKDETELRRVPLSTFATVERSVLYLVEISLLVTFVVLLNWSKTQPGQYKRYDLTALKPGQRVYSLSPKTKKVLGALHQDVQVIVFMTPPMSPDQDSIYEDVKELLTRFASRSTHIRVEYIDLHRQPTRAKALAAKYRLNLADATNIESGIGGLVVFVSGNKQKYVKANDMANYDYDQAPNGRYHQKVKSFKAEEAFLNALLNLTQTSQSRVCFSKGHGEPDIAGYGANAMGYAAEMLRRENTIVEAVGRIGNGVPKRCDLFAVVGPRLAFSDREAEAVDGYLAGGGRLLFVPQTVDIVGNVPHFAKSRLEAVLKKYGVRVQDAYALDLSLRTTQPLIWIAEKTWGKHPIAKAMQGHRVVLYMPRVLSPEGSQTIDAVSLLGTTASDKSAWGETDLSPLADPQARTIAVYTDGTDLKPPVSVAVAATSKARGGFRVVAFGSVANFMNQSLDPNQPVQDYSADFLLNSVNWLLEREQLISLSPRTPERMKLELSAKQVGRIFRVVVLGMPLFAILLGLLVWWVRRN
ncbi:MAG: GldG family protein [Deltaproteobacteria bacterium]|nr:GldG family protein [Deltaproteobacteria bacterium]